MTLGQLLAFPTPTPAVPCPRRGPHGRKCGVLLRSDDGQRMYCGTCYRTLSFETVAMLSNAEHRKRVAVTPEPSDQPWLEGFDSVPTKDAVQL